MMPEPLKKIAFVIERFAANGPGQQLLDRFLMGYPDEGVFRQLRGCTIAAHVVESAERSEVERRAKDYGLVSENSLPACIRDADAVAVIPYNLSCSSDLLPSVIANAPDGARCFVYGALAGARKRAENLIRVAEARKCILASGTSTAVAWRLPDITISRGVACRRTLIVVQGEHPYAELDALNGLLPVLESTGSTTISKIEFLRGNDVWAPLNGEFSQLLASALSRSDTPQGDALVDCRTQDLVGLGLVQKLAKSPRCWKLSHSNGHSSMIAVLDGVVADYNIAVETSGGKIWSWQLYRPPAPFEHVYSRMAAVLERFFRSGESPWPLNRSIVTAHLLEEFASRHTH
jgi:hypothetical protein